MKHLFNYCLNEGTEPEAKDIQRLQDIAKKANGDEAKAVKLAQAMAKAIKDTDKMQRRYKAALQVFGEGPVAAAFNQGFDGGNQVTIGQQKLTGLAAVKQNNPEIWNNIIKAFKAKKLNFENVQASKVVEESPEAAFKYGGTEGDKYFKLWMRNDDIAFVTWANTMIDTKFRWNAKAKNSADKRDNNDIIGTKTDVLGYLKSTPYYKKCTSVFRIPFDAFGPAAVEMVEDEKAKFMKNVEFLKFTANATLTPGEYVRKLQEFYIFVNKEIDRLSKLVESISLANGTLKLNTTKFSDSANIEFSGSIVYTSDVGLYQIEEYKQNIFCHYHLPDLNVGTYDWNGSLQATRSYYDKARVKKLGIKPAADAKKRFNEVKSIIRATLGEENLEYIEYLVKIRSEIRETESISDVNAKYASMVQRKFAQLLPGTTLARKALVDKGANYTINKNTISIKSPLPLYPPKVPIYKTKKAMSEFKKTVTKELNEYASEIIKSIDNSYNDYSLLVYLKPSFMDSLKV